MAISVKVPTKTLEQQSSKTPEHLITHEKSKFSGPPEDTLGGGCSHLSWKLSGVGGGRRNSWDPALSWVRLGLPGLWCSGGRLGEERQGQGCSPLHHLQSTPARTAGAAEVARVSFQSPGLIRGPEWVTSKPHPLSWFSMMCPQSYTIIKVYSSIYVFSFNEEMVAWLRG